jgi:hypothetical protein
MRHDIAYPAALVAIGISIVIGWRLSLPIKILRLPIWRGRLFFLGLVTNAISFGVFLMVSFGPRVVDGWLPNIYNFRVFVLLAIASILLGGFGSRIPRYLLVLNGIILAWLWLSLGASSL